MNEGFLQRAIKDIVSVPFMCNSVDIINFLGVFAQSQNGLLKEVALQVRNSCSSNPKMKARLEVAAGPIPVRKIQGVVNQALLEALDNQNVGHTVHGFISALHIIGAKSKVK